MSFDPDAYTITIRKENVDGELMYVGRVAELPNIDAFEDSFEEARKILLDAITTLKEIADEEGRPFPEPYRSESEGFSGRVTLRLPRTLHGKVARMADREDVSINQLLVTAVATYIGEADGLARAARDAVRHIHIATFEATSAGTPVIKTDFEYVGQMKTREITTSARIVAIPFVESQAYGRHSHG